MENTSKHPHVNRVVGRSTLSADAIALVYHTAFNVHIIAYLSLCNPRAPQRDDGRKPART